MSARNSMRKAYRIFQTGAFYEQKNQGAFSHLAFQNDQMQIFFLTYMAPVILYRSHIFILARRSTGKHSLYLLRSSPGTPSYNAPANAPVKGNTLCLSHGYVFAMLIADVNRSEWIKLNSASGTATMQLLSVSW